MNGHDLIPPVVRAAALVAVFAGAPMLAAAAQDPREAGRALYQERCVHCHGAEGRGDGPAAPYLDPPPRDFTTGRFKLRSTPFDALPTEDDLLIVLAQGIPGTAMTAWDDYREAERRELVRYVLSLVAPDSGVRAAPPLAPAAEIPATPDLVAQGERLFQDLKCVLCHGQEGRGDGPIATRLRFTWDLPFRARDLTRNWRFQRGATAAQIHQTLTTGLAGTPMGSYADLATEQERWALAHYVRSLTTTAPESEVVLRAARWEGPLPTTPDDAAWQAARPYTLELTGQIMERPSSWTPSVDAVTVRALHWEHEICLLLEWADPTADQSPLYRDAVTLQFPARPPQGTEKPFFFRGERGAPVQLWTWEAEVTAGGSGEPPASGDPWSPAREQVAEGTGKVRATPASSQEVRTSGRWVNGRWQVLFRRALRTEDPEDLAFEVGQLLPFAVQVHDGANGDADRQMAVSAWHTLHLEPPASLERVAWALFAGLAGLNLELWLLPALCALVRRVRETPDEEGGPA